jgi:hypothetical protein
MPKTANGKHVKNKTIKIKGCAHNPTYHDVRKWYESSFEKLGWMILAQRHGYSDKIEQYKKNIMHLRDCISKKHSKMNDLDRKEDLRIMLDNVEVLIKHIHKDF